MIIKDDWEWINNGVTYKNDKEQAIGPDTIYGTSLNRFDSPVWEALYPSFL